MTFVSLIALFALALPLAIPPSGSGTGAGSLAACRGAACLGVAAVCVLGVQEVLEMRTEGRLAAEGPQRSPASGCHSGLAPLGMTWDGGLRPPGRHWPAFLPGNHVFLWCPPDAQDGRDKHRVQGQVHRKRASSHGCRTPRPSLHSQRGPPPLCLPSHILSPAVPGETRIAFSIVCEAVPRRPSLEVTPLCFSVTCLLQPRYLSWPGLKQSSLAIQLSVPVTTKVEAPVR